MPFYLNDRDISTELAAIDSALIVPCRFCPAASLAVREAAPYIAPFRNLLRTPSYESHVRLLKSRLERAGIRTDVFDSRWPHQFVACMWTAGRRRALAKRAAPYDALIVLGCDAAVETVRRSVEGTSCRVIPAMQVEGIMNVVPRVHYPFHVRLEVIGVTRVLENSIPPLR
jgi:hypothetical protein